MLVVAKLAPKNQKESVMKKIEGTSLVKIGSDWGGWIVEPNIIPNQGTVISAGLAGDITFDIGVLAIRPQCVIVGIEPTDHGVVAVDRERNKGTINARNYILLHNAIYGESGKEISLGGAAISIFMPGTWKSTTIGIKDVLSNYAPVVLLKMDIEGSEFSVIEAMPNVTIPQIAIEFHHWLDGSPFKLEDTLAAIKKIKDMGYKLVYKEKTQVHMVFQNTLFIRSDLAPNYEDLTENSTVEWNYSGSL
jgi:hypothetical protein